ncbi:MAG TPA: phosphohistidine phosphatase SixA [Planctomycetota bacterium]|jgi:phosphohistidine phosphatase
MKIILARHAAAEDKAATDAERRLTPEGREQADLMGRLIAATIERVDQLWTSPLPRALETAEIAAKHLGVIPKVEPELAIGSDLEQLCWKMHRDNEPTLMLVGHQPDLGRLAARLLGLVSEIPLKKSGVCILETPDPAKPVARAVATLDPRQYRDILEGREYAPWMIRRQVLGSSSTGNNVR